MNFKLNILCILNLIVLTIQGLKLFSFRHSHRRLMKQKSDRGSTRSNILCEWINQKLDHFNSSETRTWKMRYFKRLDYWQPNGPIYLIIGDESTTDPLSLKIGLVLELAKETNGAMFISEHRYYGKSQPLKGRNVEDMKFLTTAQTLADNAKLIRKIKRNMRFKHSKIVLYGASYGGNLATWMRLVYPNLVDAAIASSAPVLAKRDFYESLEVVNDDYKKYGTPGCLDDIRRIFRRYDSLFRTKGGIKQLKEEENICKDVDLNKFENKVVFFMTKLDPFFDFAQDGNINDINYHCQNLNTIWNMTHNISDDKFWFEKENCNSYDFNRMVLKTQKDIDEYSWCYQTCTEYGYIPSTTSNNQPFTKNMPVEYGEKYCKALFGPKFGKQKIIDGVRKINQKYGGRSPNVTKVVFINGELDPWSSLSVLNDISPEAPAMVIPKASHANEIWANEDNSYELEKAKSKIKYFVKKWINEPKPRSVEFNLSLSICINC